MINCMQQMFPQREQAVGFFRAYPILVSSVSSFWTGWQFPRALPLPPRVPLPQEPFQPCPRISKPSPGSWRCPRETRALASAAAAPSSAPPLWPLVPPDCMPSRWPGRIPAPHNTCGQGLTRWNTAIGLQDSGCSCRQMPVLRLMAQCSPWC